MMEIPRYRMTNNLGELDTDNGSWIKYEDHVAAMQAVLPQPKFTVGDRVTWDKDLGTVAEPDDESSPCQEPYYVNVNWDDGNYGTVRSSDLSLYTPPTPDPKFKIGDRVLLDEQPEVLVITGILSSQSVASDWSYDVCTTTGMPVTRVSSSRLDLYTPPTPAELIPTLKEHEWVRGTCNGGLSTFEGAVYSDGKALRAGIQILRYENLEISPYIGTIERCDAPEVK